MEVVFGSRTPGVLGGDSGYNSLFHSELFPSKLPLFTFSSCVVVFIECLYGDIHPVREKFLAVALIQPMCNCTAPNRMG